MAKTKADRPLSATVAAVLLEFMTGVSLVAALVTATLHAQLASRIGAASIPAAAAVVFGVCAFAVLKGLSWARFASAIVLGVAGLFGCELMVGIVALGASFAGGDAILLAIAVCVAVPPFVAIVAAAVLISMPSGDDWYRAVSPGASSRGSPAWFGPTALCMLLLAVGAGVYARYAQYVANGAHLPPGSRPPASLVQTLFTGVGLLLVTLVAAVYMARRREAGRFVTVVAGASAFMYPVATVGTTSPAPELFGVWHIAVWVLSAAAVLMVTRFDFDQTIHSGSSPASV